MEGAVVVGGRRTDRWEGFIPITSRTIRHAMKDTYIAECRLRAAATQRLPPCLFELGCLAVAILFVIGKKTRIAVLLFGKKKLEDKIRGMTCFCTVRT